jgi:hypothetical protein
MTLKVLTLNLWNRDGPWSERAKLVGKCSSRI